MKRVLVIGCPGSGKSTFCRALHTITQLPLCHLDMLYWNPDKTTVPKEYFMERLCRVLDTDAWIMDGNFSSTMELRMQACDTVIFLDYPTELCLQGVRNRIGTPRSDIPWVETEEDPEFMTFIRDFQTQRKPQILALLEKYSKKNIHRFTSRQEAEQFLQQL
ncbi:MAG: adenylate kinase [Oscillospiraceae bacterium]|nr:adenylate kinase [Oscillospiraceae bacterium]